MAEKNNPVTWPKGFGKWYIKNCASKVIVYQQAIFATIFNPGIILFVESHWAPLKLIKSSYCFVDCFSNAVLSNTLFFKSCNEMEKERGKKFKVKQAPYIISYQYVDVGGYYIIVCSQSIYNRVGDKSMTYWPNQQS